MQNVQDVRVSTTFPAPLLAVLDQHRREQADLPSRAETIRRLCQEALAKSMKPRARSRKVK
jgi:metal-responsive CopG/Arc/MetJ family transcriptional regulator